MCVIIHKPAGARIPSALLVASASLNRDGWGLMGFAADGALIVERHAHVCAHDLLAAEEKYQDAEIALHLRLLTRGSTHPQNQHPIAIDDDCLLMHNGTIEGLDSEHVGLSDSWHLARQVLKPLLQRDPDLLSQPAFLKLIELALGVQNRAVLLHAPSRRLHVLNRSSGSEIEGLWCSSTRWIDQRLYALPLAPQKQERSLETARITFI